MAGIRLLAEYRQNSPGSSSSNRNGSFRFEKDVSPESSSSDQRELRRIPANKDAAAAPLRSPEGGDERRRMRAYVGRRTKVSKHWGMTSQSSDFREAEHAHRRAVGACYLWDRWPSHARPVVEKFRCRGTRGFALRRSPLFCRRFSLTTLPSCAIIYYHPFKFLFI